MLTKEQKSLLKRAQRQADLPDVEYRDALMLIAGVLSSTDPKIGDRHLDKLMGYFEAIYWGKVDQQELRHAPGTWDPFLKRDYWKHKNTAQETSRDRFAKGSLAQTIATLEREMAELGCNGYYCNAIRIRVTGGSSEPGQLWRYKAALERTLAAKRKKAEKTEPVDATDNPF